MLSKLQKLREEREQGFTLIELLVVILIIGILAAIAIPAFLNQRKSAVDSSVQSDVSNAAKQVESAAVKAGAGNLTFALSTATAATNGKIALGNGIETQVSEGTKLRITGDTRDGYTIIGTNDGGDVSKTTGFTYSSANGGMN